jgi:hypothetical protein
MAPGHIRFVQHLYGTRVLVLYLCALTLKYGPVVVLLFVAISYTFASCTSTVNLNKEINLIIFFSILFYSNSVKNILIYL